MKDYLTYKMMANLGVAAPLVSYVWVTVNGQDFGSFSTDASAADGGYSVNLKALLSALGLTLSYDEEKGTVTVTDPNGLLDSLLGN